MPRTIFLSERFTLEPYRWGLRGDPWLWRDMRQRVSATPLPATDDQLVAILEARFEELTAHPISHAENFHLPQWWRDTAVPLLRERHVAA